MAEVMKNVAVAVTATEVGRFKKWVLLKNNSDVVMYLSFVKDGNLTLSVDTGYPLAVGETLWNHKDNDESPMALKETIYALHWGSGSKSLRVQGE